MVGSWRKWKTKMMKNIELNLNKYIPLDKVDAYLRDGWTCGYIKRSGKNAVKKN